MRTAAPDPQNKSCGSALVIALTLLLALTLLGMGALGLATLEERMAGNAQSAIGALALADSGIQLALSDSEPLNKKIPRVTGVPADLLRGGRLRVTTRFREMSVIPRGSGFSEDQFEAAHYDIEAEARTATGATAVIHQGIVEIAPKVDAP